MANYCRCLTDLELMGDTFLRGNIYEYNLITCTVKHSINKSYSFTHSHFNEVFKDCTKEAIRDYKIADLFSRF